MSTKFDNFINYFYDLDRAKYFISMFLLIVILSVLLFWDSVASQLRFENDLEKIPVIMGFISLLLGLLVDMIYRNNKLMKQMEYQLEYPFERVHTIDSFKSEIISNIKNAKEIWLLSRTGINWWQNFFMDSLNELNPPTCHFLFICPEFFCPKKNEMIPCYAMNMAKSVMSDQDPKKERIVDWQKDTLKAIKKFFDNVNSKNNNGGQSYSELRTIDYLPSWTLLFVNPVTKNGDSVIYVEFTTYNHRDKFSRPASRITLKNIEHFDIFAEEFRKMWEKADPWIPEEDEKYTGCKGKIWEKAKLQEMNLTG